MQCTVAIRHRTSEGQLERQARKHLIIESLAATLQGLVLSDFPNLQRAVARLGETLRRETEALTEALDNLQHELSTVSAAQTRLTQASRYDAIAPPLSTAAGRRLSVCG